MTHPDDHVPSQPRVIPRAEHGISRKQISPNALRVLYRLREGGFSAHLVGGAVRDLLLGGAPKDFDVATSATPEQVRHLFRNCRLIGRRFRLAHVMFGREIIEVATFRANIDDGTGDRELDNGRLVRDNVFGSIEEDAFRRDFTVNALYYSIEDFSVIDYVGGYEDVRHRTLRLIGDPEDRYREDSVRMLRAVRLAAKLGFDIEPAAAEAIPRLARLLDAAAPARLFEESLKMFLAGHGEQSFLALERHGLLPVLFPETAKALAEQGAPARRMVLTALANTDLRVQEDRPVTPAFLFAALLWPAYQRTLDQLLAQDVDAAVAHQRAADRVTLHQADRIALPRRFSTPMQEIWALQPRFEQRQRKRVFRLLGHPRFRAAFDFLELRTVQDPALTDDAAWWREAQVLEPDALVQRLDPNRAGAARGGEPADGSDKPPRRRRRRRRRTGADGEAAGGDAGGANDAGA